MDTMAVILCRLFYQSHQTQENRWNVLPLPKEKEENYGDGGHADRSLQILVRLMFIKYEEALSSHWSPVRPVVVVNPPYDRQR
jgi:hypothetical protein